MSSRTVRVPNISCGHCVATVEREVGDLEGVTRVRALLDDQQVTVEWDDGRTSWGEIETLMTEINYPPEPAD